MIKTKDLIELIGESRGPILPPENALIREYKDEIVARLRAYDELLKELKKEA